MRTPEAAAAYAAANFHRHANMLATCASVLSEQASRRLRRRVESGELWGLVYAHFVHVCRYYRAEKGPMDALFAASRPYRLLSQFCRAESLDADFGSSAYSRVDDGVRRVRNGLRTTPANERTPARTADTSSLHEAEDEALWGWIRTVLRPRVFAVFSCVYRDREQGVELARRLGVSRQAITNTCNLAILKLARAHGRTYTEFSRRLGDGLVRRRLGDPRCQGVDENDLRATLRLPNRSS